MSVLIKGMEMPKNCGECLLAKLSPTGESLICNYMLSRVPWDERPFDCPLVPVPLHGRLIDADALIEAMARMVPWAITDPTANAFLDGLSAAYNAIQAAPTIIEAEEGEAEE